MNRTMTTTTIALVAVARLHLRLPCCCRRHSPPLRHPPPSSPSPSPTLSPLPSPSSPSLALVAVALAAVALALFVARHPRRPCPCRTHPLLRPLRRRSTATLVTVAIAISSLALFVAALIIRRALSLFVVACRPAHVHRPTLTLPSLVDCCFFTPPADGGGRLGASSAPPIQRTRPTPPRRRSKNASRGCGVAATATAIPALASGQFWPTPSPGACTTGATRGRGGRAGMLSFGAISIASAMVSECFCSGLWKSLRREGIILRKVWYEGVGIKIENLLTNERRKVRQRHLILFAPTNISL
jgi:hypothetical protein